MPKLRLLGFVPIRRSRSSILVHGGRDLDGFFEIFEILGGAGDINNSISMRNY